MGGEIGLELGEEVGGALAGGVLTFDSPKLQILGSVVGAVAVLVVDTFVSFERAAERLLHDVTVFKGPPVTVGSRVFLANLYEIVTADASPANVANVAAADFLFPPVADGACP